MVSEEYRVGLAATIGAYLTMVGLAGLYGWRTQRQRMKSMTVQDELSAHYLSGKSLGTFVTTMTIFASLFSGYTAVGVPNEAYRTGWLACRWIPVGLSVAVGLLGTTSRLKKVSIVRNHQSPVDFITDRFKSQSLRYTIVFLQLFPSIIYLIAQATAINSTFNAMFGIPANNPIALLALSSLILAYEWLGGLSSVAWTDVIQGVVMLAMYIILPILISVSFGGWVNLDPMTYPKPTFYQVPSTSQQYNMWCFVILCSSFFTLPHFVQRTYAAGSMKALKSGMYIVTTGSWMLMLVGVFIGTMGVYILQDEPSPSSPFSAIMEKVMAISPFAYGIGCLAYTAALAGIMSTADSLLIAISQLFVSEVVRPLKPNASSHQVTMIGKIISLICMFIAITVTLTTGPRSNLSKLGAIQFGISLQAVPAFLVGLFATSRTDIHPWIVSFGAIAGFISTFLIHFLYNVTKPSFRIDPGLHGCAINVACCILGEITLRCWGRYRCGNWKSSIQMFSSPQWDKPNLERFGDVALTPDSIWKMMKGIYEPFLDSWYPFLLLVISVAMLPLTSNGMPPLNEDGTLAYAPNLVAGLPDWVFCFLMFNAVLTLVMLVAIYRIPNKLSEDEASELDVIKPFVEKEQEVVCEKFEENVAESSDVQLVANVVDSSV